MDQLTNVAVLVYLLCTHIFSCGFFLRFSKICIVHFQFDSTNIYYLLPLCKTKDLVLWEVIKRDRIKLLTWKHWLIFRRDVMFAKISNIKSCQIYCTEISTLIISPSASLYVTIFSFSEKHNSSQRIRIIKRERKRNVVFFFLNFKINSWSPFWFIRENVWLKFLRIKEEVE